jgi:hypothetical protein
MSEALLCLRWLMLLSLLRKKESRSFEGLCAQEESRSRSKLKKNSTQRLCSSVNHYNTTRSRQRVFSVNQHQRTNSRCSPYSVDQHTATHSITLKTKTLLCGWTQKNNLNTKTLLFGSTQHNKVNIEALPVDLGARLKGHHIRIFRELDWHKDHVRRPVSLVPRFEFVNLDWW